jgi:hypothetical protein
VKVFNQCFSDYHLVLKRLSNTFKHKVYIRNPLFFVPIVTFVNLKAVNLSFFSCIMKMTDFTTIRVLNVSGKKEDWLTWSEKFQAKA